jgi:hypothetical protein
MKVAGHEMPGNLPSESPSRRVPYDELVGTRYRLRIVQSTEPKSHRTRRDGSSLNVSQAFHAWLPSLGPSGTIRARCCFNGNAGPTLLRIVTSCVLGCVLGFSYLCSTGVTRAADHSFAVSQHLDIRVQANAFGSASPADIEAVLRSAGAELLRYCPHSQLAGIEVYYRPDHPEINSKRTPGGRIAMVLSARDTHWAQYSFQFAHEFCHALANYANSSQRTIPDTSNANLWFEESLCETASLFCLRAMSRTWQVNPPYPAFRAYAPWLADYAEQRLALPEHRLPAGTSFADWFRQHQLALRKDAIQRDKNAIIAARLLPIFEAEPAGWEAVIFLNRGSSNGQESLAQHFAQWRANCPVHLRPFVSKLATVFGVRFRPGGTE